MSAVPPLWGPKPTLSERINRPITFTRWRELRFGGLVGGPVPIIDEAHGERLAGHAVSKRLREGQGGAALDVSATAVRYDARSASEASPD